MTEEVAKGRTLPWFGRLAHVLPACSELFTYFRCIIASLLSYCSVELHGSGLSPYLQLFGCIVDRFSRVCTSVYAQLILRPIQLVPCHSRIHPCIDTISIGALLGNRSCSAELWQLSCLWTAEGLTS